MKEEAALQADPAGLVDVVRVLLARFSREQKTPIWSLLLFLTWIIFVPYY